MSVTFKFRCLSGEWENRKEVLLIVTKKRLLWVLLVAALSLLLTLQVRRILAIQKSQSIMLDLSGWNAPWRFETSNDNENPWWRWLPGAQPRLAVVKSSFDASQAADGRLGRILSYWRFSDLVMMVNATDEFFGELGVKEDVTYLYCYYATNLDDSMLGNLEMFPNVENLDIGHIGATFSGFPLLEKLQILQITDCRVSQEGVSRIAQLPNLRECYFIACDVDTGPLHTLRPKLDLVVQP